MNREPHDYKFEYPTSPEQLAAIGQIVIEGSALEDGIEWAIWGLLGLSAETGELFTTRQNLEAKVNTLTRVIQKSVQDSEQRIKAAEIMGRMKESSGRRNDIVHAIWPIISRATRIVALSRKLANKGAASRPLKVDVAALTQIAADLSADFHALMGWLDTIPSFKAPYIRGEVHASS